MTTYKVEIKRITIGAIIAQVGLTFGAIAFLIAAVSWFGDKATCTAFDEWRDCVSATHSYVLNLNDAALMAFVLAVYLIITAVAWFGE